MAKYEDILNEIQGKKYTDVSNRNQPFTAKTQNIPFKATTTTKKKKNKIVKSSSLFDDGYDKGDVTKTILATSGDLLANVGKGFMNTIEGVVDTARTGFGDLTKASANIQADIWDFLGNKSYASSLRKAGQDVKDLTYRNAQMDVTGALLGETNDLFRNNWSKSLNEKSVAGSMVNSVEQGIGNIGAFVGLAGIGGLGAEALGLEGASAQALTSLTSSNASTFLNSFTSAYGNTLTNGLRNGLDEKEAKGQAITSGLAEAISEQVFQGIPGLKSAGWAENLISKPIGKYFSGKTGKVALKVMDSVGEGLEEFISNVLQTTFEGIRTNKNVKDIFSELGDTIKSEETREAMISAFISSALTNGGSALITNQQKNSIIKSYAEEHDMSVEETKNLFDSIVEKKANLEDTSNYKERVDLEENIGRNLAKEMKGNVDLNELFKQTPNSVKEMQFRFSQDEANNVKSDKQNILANDMARINDVEENHKLYKIVNAIQSANDTQQYHITTTEGLYEMGIVNKDENGNYTMPDGSPYVPRGLNYKNGEIYINADVGSQSGTQAVYHEMFEGFKKAAPEQYNEFKQMVTDIIGEDAIQKEFDTYKSMYGEELTDDIRDEIINDKFGELAENQNFINKIADNRNVLEKFIDSIKNMIKYVKGTDEERQLMKLQKNLEKEFAKRYKETDFSQGEGDTAYSLKESKAMLEKQFKDLTGDSLLVAEAKLGNYAFQQIRGNQVEAPYNQEAMDLLEKIQNSKKTSSHLYHSTPADRIQSIAKNGLVVGSKQNQEGVSSTNKLYLSATEELADSFTPENSVMLRISPNAKLENLDNDLLGGEGSYTITNNIEPKYLQVKENGKWIPLLKSKYANDTKYSLSPTGEMVDSKGNKVEFEVSEVDTQLPISDDKKLMVLHNLGENKMNGIMDLDGIPVPSLAITNPNKVAHSGFGEATLIFKKDTIDPANRLNEVYDRDVWSPTQPQIDYDIKFDDLMDLEDKIYNKHDAIAGTALNRYFDRENLSDNVDRYGIEGTIEEAKNSDELKYIYYKTMNPDFEILKKTDTEDLSSRYSNELLQEFNTQYGKEIPNWMNISDEQRKEVINDFRNYWKPILEARRDEIIAEENAKPEPKRFVIRIAESSVDNNLEWLDSLGGQDKLIEHLHEIQNNGGTREVNDIEGTKEFVNNNINQEEYNKWVDDTLGNLLRTAEKGIYNGKDYITANGRRTFKQLHDKYTLENLVKALTKGDTKGTQQTMVTGYGQIQAQLANQFNSIEEIRNAENQIMSDEEAKALTEQLHNAINEDIDALADRLDGDYFNMNNASEMIFEYAGKKNRNEETFRKIAKDYANHGIPSELIQKITNDLEQLKNMPTDYFEAKPQRAVGLDEIGIGLIPTTWSDETKQRMRDKGIKFIEYDKSIEGERQRLEKELTDFMFSLTSNQNIDSKEIAPIREDISNLTEKIDNLSTQLETIQNGAEMTSNEEIAPVRPTYKEMQRANALNNTEISPEEAYKDENYWNTIDEIAQENNNQLDSKLAKKLSKNMASELGLKKKQIDDMQSIINEAWDEGLSYDQIRLKLWEEFGHGTVMQKNEEAIDAQKLIKEYPIKVSDNIKKDITDYGYWKQKYFGKIKFSKDGGDVENVYGQLSDKNPSMFPKDIWNPTDQLLRIAEVADLEKKYSVDYEMSLQDMDAAANYIHDTFVETMYNNAMKQQTDLEEQALQYNERTKDIPYKKKTRAEVREFLQNGMGITTEDLQAGNDIKALSYQITTPERVNEKVFGREVGKKINEQTVNFAKHQEAERIRFLAKERQEIADLGIKARSKESALVQQYGEGLLDDVQLAQQVEDKATQDKIKHAAKVLRQKYDDYLDMINEELVDMGYDPIPKRKDYMRHFQELTDKFSMVGIPFNRQDLNANNLPTDINGLTEFNVPGKNWFASALKRTGNKTTYDAITGIDGYLEGASNLMYHTETIQRYRALEKLIRDTYGQTHGMEAFGDDISSEQAMQRLQDIENGKLSNYVAWLKEQGNAIAGKKTALDRAPERLFGRKGYSFFNTLKKSTGSNMTGLNVRSALTNFISSTIAASKTDKMAMAHGTIDTIKNMFHDDGFIDKSDFLTSRLRSDTSLSKKTWQKIANAGQIFMSGSDWFTSNLIVRSKYYEGLSKGMTESQAMKYADDFGARVMGDRSKGATAEAFNSKTLGFLTQFQLETNNQWQYMIHDSKMEFQENLAKEGGLKAGATLVFQMGQLAAYSYLFNEMFEKLTGSRAAFDPVDIFKKLFAPDDDDKDKDFETRMKEAGKELADALPFTSLFGSGGRLPINDMLTPAGTLYDYITGGTNKYGQEITLEDVKDEALSSLPYYVLPTGYGQLKKTVQGLGMYDKDNPVPGSYTDSGNLRYTADTDTASVIKNALFGQWSGEEAKKYRESGYKTIRANDIQEMQDLGMKSSEYREYKENLKEAGTKNADKLNYINSLDIPINEKNIMASNVLDRNVDMSNYDSYEEFDYAYKNPQKYNAMKLIANDYNDYKEYISGIDNVREQNKNLTTEGRKKKVISYVNSLDLTIPQKAMLIRQYYSSYKNYNKEIVNYVSSSDMDYEDKVEVLKSLKFKVDDEGNVSW